MLEGTREQLLLVTRAIDEDLASAPAGDRDRNATRQSHPTAIARERARFGFPQPTERKRTDRAARDAHGGREKCSEQGLFALPHPSQQHTCYTEREQKVRRVPHRQDLKALGVVMVI